MKDYYFIIRKDGSMVWKGSGHGPAMYHDMAQVKRYGAQQSYHADVLGILHLYWDGEKFNAVMQDVPWEEE